MNNISREMEVLRKAQKKIQKKKKKSPENTK